MISSRRLTTLVLAVAAAAAIGACEKKPAAGPGDGQNAPKQPQQPPKAPAAALPADLFLVAAPADAVGVKAGKAAAKKGDTVVLRGRIGGMVEPFASGRAIFTLMDMELPVCSDNPDDHCGTPWDYCCEDRADITANAASIQVTDAVGSPLKTDLKDVHNLQPMTEVHVVGVVSTRDEAGTFVVNATKIWVGPMTRGKGEKKPS